LPGAFEILVFNRDYIGYCPVPYTANHLKTFCVHSA
jgi:hypothetical protein